MKYDLYYYILNCILKVSTVSFFHICPYLLYTISLSHNLFAHFYYHSVRCFKLVFYFVNDTNAVYVKLRFKLELFLRNIVFKFLILTASKYKISSIRFITIRESRMEHLNTR